MPPRYITKRKGVMENMKIRIYQINSDRDENRMMFLSHDRLERFQGSPEVDSKIYDKVYDKEVDCSNLEEVYTLLNIDHPEDYRGRSLSVSDVVEVYESDAIPQGFYFCDSFGFKQVTFHPEKCGISERMNEQSTEIISVLLVEPGKYPRMIEIEDSLEAMQRVVGGDIEEFMPYEDDIAIICNEEGKMNGMSPNRAIYSEPEEVEMTYGELTGRFRQAEREGRHISGYIVFTQDSFTEAYSEEQRTYAVSSNNKAFIEGMGGYSIYASSLDGSDPCVRLEAYMADEHGGKDGWKIERCYMKDPESREMVDIIFGQFFVCYAPAESEKFLSLPKELAQKYEARFKFPERFSSRAMKSRLSHISPRPGVRKGRRVMSEENAWPVTTRSFRQCISGIGKSWWEKTRQTNRASPIWLPTMKATRFWADIMMR